MVKDPVVSKRFYATIIESSLLQIITFIVATKWGSRKVFLFSFGKNRALQPKDNTFLLRKRSKRTVTVTQKFSLLRN